MLMLLRFVNAAKTQGLLRRQSVRGQGTALMCGFSSRNQCRQQMHGAWAAACLPKR